MELMELMVLMESFYSLAWATGAIEGRRGGAILRCRSLASCGIAVLVLSAPLRGQRVMEARVAAVVPSSLAILQARQLEVPTSVYTRMANATGATGAGWLFGVSVSKLLDGRRVTDSLTQRDKNWAIVPAIVAGILAASLPKLDNRCSVKRRFAAGLLGAGIGIGVGGIAYAADEEKYYGYIALLISGPYGAAIGSQRQCWS
jgi:hypothetical protein